MDSQWSFTRLLCLIQDWHDAHFNPNKAGLFESSFFWGGQFDAPSYFKKNLSNMSITLYNC